MVRPKRPEIGKTTLVLRLAVTDNLAASLPEAAEQPHRRVPGHQGQAAPAGRPAGRYLTESAGPRGLGRGGCQWRAPPARPVLAAARATPGRADGQTQTTSRRVPGPSEWSAAAGPGHWQRCRRVTPARESAGPCGPESRAARRAGPAPRHRANRDCNRRDPGPGPTCRPGATAVTIVHRVRRDHRRRPGATARPQRDTCDTRMQRPAP